VLLEAMASGRPAVSTAISGIPEIVRSAETGILVQPGDALALADALARLCSEPALAAAMGVRARTRCEQLFDLRVNASKLRQLLIADGDPIGTA
jgi:glycosyltransferase involved in cell wall biosynthesis